MNKISILIPTRNRPHNMDSVVNSIKNTISTENEFEIVFYIDNDDEKSLDKFNEIKCNNILAKIGPRILLSNTWNRAYMLSSGNIIMLCGDDVLFKSKNWDIQIVNKFNEYKDKILLVYGYDGYHHKFGTHSFISKKWVETLGYAYPPFFWKDNCDLWINDVAKAINRQFFLKDLLFEHMHPDFNKSKSDETYENKHKFSIKKTYDINEIYSKFKYIMNNNVSKLKKIIYPIISSQTRNKLTDIVEDRIFVMNLKSRPDRLQDSINEFKKIGIDKYTIIESYGIDSEIPQQYKDRIIKTREKYTDYNIDKKREGLKITTTEVMRISLEKNYPNILLLEDDFLFKNNYEEILSKALEQLIEREWDWFQLGANYKIAGGRVEKETENLLRICGPPLWAAHAIIMKKNIIEDIYNNMIEYNGYNDHFINYEIYPKYKCYLCHPGACTQREGYSDLDGYSYDPSQYIN